jgi:ABC-type Fe3+/spermidine/putrescine transport system ATPase subunit
MDNLLVVQDLRVTYGGVTAVDKVSLTVNEGEIVGLIGPNGAGKSSLIDALTGYHPAAGGQVTFAGVPITGARPYRIARRGLIRTFQSVELFDDLTVEENLLVAAEQPSPWSVLRDLVAPPRPRRNENVAWALDACGLDDVTGRGHDPDGRQGHRGQVSAPAGPRRAVAGSRGPGAVRQPDRGGEPPAQRGPRRQPRRRPGPAPRAAQVPGPQGRAAVRR